ncbi:unnamed protein product [Didymodactylos carnosus]|uniref:Coronin n=1 Tax=Didymodactylos carnosus TaxID=1234261 RepID=A0A814B2W5_9BILA|nr:unnamed protein product [Didymodactylos carnosus]CAF0922345.1 unnamed protein product [Didymodactylos carnosus]CAF3690789.1 unnamed protein product [Didymodactylos carnosus]CAF3701507.1 unnamed protein product [Didymodactylos carnosus]
MTRVNMPFKVRISKFRHVYGSPYREDCCYKNIPITRNAHDGGFCAVNAKFLAVVTETSGGGSFLVLQLSEVGRVDVDHSRVTGHRGPVVDLKWNPFNDNEIASCSDDGTVKVWYIPDGGLRSDMYQWKVDLHGHQRRVDYIEWHPTAQNLILSAGLDHQSITWNKNGSLFATTCKDKRIRVIEARSGRVVTEGIGHQGPKTSKIVFLGDMKRLLSTGFGKTFERQIGIWNASDLSKPLLMETVDFSAGALIPFYDHDTRTVYLAGKGDGNIRYYEVNETEPYLHFLSEYKSASPQRCLGIMPKIGLDVTKNEIMRFYKLFATGSICEPISMIVPRKAEAFQIDIYPDTPGPYPALSADEWINGCDREPILVSMKDRTETNMPKITTYRTIESSTSQTPPSIQRHNHLYHSTRTVPPPVAEIAPTLINKPVAKSLPQLQQNDNNNNNNNSHDLDLEKQNNKINLEKNNQQQETSPILKSSTLANHKGLRKIESLKMPSTSTEFNNVSSLQTVNDKSSIATVESDEKNFYKKSVDVVPKSSNAAVQRRKLRNCTSISATQIADTLLKSSSCATLPLKLKSKKKAGVSSDDTTIMTRGRPNLYKTLHSINPINHARSTPDLSEYFNPIEELKSSESSSSIEKLSDHYAKTNIEPIYRLPNKRSTTVEKDQYSSPQPSSILKRTVTQTPMRELQPRPLLDVNTNNNQKLSPNNTLERLAKNTPTIFSPSAAAYFKEEQYTNIDHSLPKQEIVVNKQPLKTVVPSIEDEKQFITSVSVPRRNLRPIKLAQRSFTEPLEIDQQTCETTTPPIQTDPISGERSSCVKALRSIFSTNDEIPTSDSNLNRSFSFHRQESELPAVDLNNNNREKFLHFNDVTNSPQQQGNRRSIEIKKKVWSVDPATTTTTTNNGSEHVNGHSTNGIDYRQAYMKQQEELKSIRELLLLKDNRIRLLEDELRTFKSDTEGNYR